jgi:Ala-tRNA(Pro) deacylase
VNYRGQEKVYETLKTLNINFEYYEHKPAPTIEDALTCWRGIESTFCKNLFFRNHKGNKHYLVVLEHSYHLDIHDLEQRLKQGKISFASPERLAKYLGLKGGSVSPFGLVNDVENHVHVFIDINLRKASKLSFHPNDNTASLVVKTDDFIRYMEASGNTYEFIELYNSN